MSSIERKDDSKESAEAERQANIKRACEEHKHYCVFQNSMPYLAEHETECHHDDAEAGAGNIVTQTGSRLGFYVPG